MRAVTRDKATKLKEDGEKRREKADKRNMYLLREGGKWIFSINDFQLMISTVILPNTPAAENLPSEELEKRTTSFNTRRALLKSNPSLYVSRTRLSVRQLPSGVTEHMLKRLANYAVREFEEEVKKKERSALDPEELVNPPGEEEQEPPKKRKTSWKVKQTKVIRTMDKVDPITGKGKSRGYGFLELHEHADALRVLRWANNNIDLAPLWTKWWKDELAELMKQQKSGMKKEDSSNPEDKEDSGNRMKRLKEELEKDLSGKWNTKGSLIVEFSIENVQVTQRRDRRGTGTVSSCYPPGSQF